MSVEITYFVHGTTIDNEKNKSTGWNQGELSELGIKQSKELAELIKDKKFDIVFTSDLKRALDSAKLLLRNRQEKIIVDERLRECNYGDFNGSDEEIVIYEEHITESFPNGESLKDVEKRILHFIKYLEKNYKNKQIAIVAHKATQLAFEVLLNNKNWEKALEEDWRKTKNWKPGWNYYIK